MSVWNKKKSNNYSRTSSLCSLVTVCLVLEGETNHLFINLQRSQTQQKGKELQQLKTSDISSDYVGDLPHNAAATGTGGATPTDFWTTWNRPTACWSASRIQTEKTTPGFGEDFSLCVVGGVCSPGNIKTLLHVLCGYCCATRSESWVALSFVAVSAVQQDRSPRLGSHRPLHDTNTWTLMYLQFLHLKLFFFIYEIYRPAHFNLRCSWRPLHRLWRGWLYILYIFYCIRRAVAHEYKLSGRVQ